MCVNPDPVSKERMYRAGWRLPFWEDLQNVHQLDWKSESQHHNPLVLFKGLQGGPGSILEEQH